MAYSQISSWLEFEIRAEGSNNNGGGFVNQNNTDVTAGTDRSQQDDPHVEIGGGTVTAVCATGSDRDSIILSNHTCSGDDVGNLVNIVSAASGIFPGLYLITSVPGTNQWNFSEDCRDSTGDSAPLGITTANMGGAWADLGFLGEKQDVWFDDGQCFAVWVKAGTYTYSTTSVNAEGGSFQAKSSFPGAITGYTTTRGDARSGGSLPVLDVASSGFTGRMIDFEDSQTFAECNWLVLDGGGTATYGVFGGGVALYAGHSCVGTTVRDLNTESGWGFYSPLTCSNCTVDGAFGGFGNAIASTNCVAKNCKNSAETGGYGFKGAAKYLGYGNLAYNCQVGFDADAYNGLWVNCVADSCNQGFYIRKTTIHQCVATNCSTGFGASHSYYAAMFDCAGFNCTTMTSQVAVESGFATLTADPWEDQSSQDFRLNDTAGGGAVLRGRGAPYPTQTALVDTNAFITERSGGGSTTVVTPGPVQIGM